MGGGIAALLTTPLDVIKTVLNTQESITASQHCQPCPKEGMGNPRVPLSSSYFSNPNSTILKGKLIRLRNIGESGEIGGQKLK